MVAMPMMASIPEDSSYRFANDPVHKHSFYLSLGSSECQNTVFLLNIPFVRDRVGEEEPVAYRYIFIDILIFLTINIILILFIVL